MTTNYPTSIDNFVNPAGTATLASPDHAGQHTDINDAVEAIETELGTSPKGSKASVKARLDDVDTAITARAVLASANTFTTNQIISGSSASALLRITQTGAGNALVVEDEANPDSTPFVVDATGRVAIGGTTATDANLRVSKTITGATTSHGVYSIGTVQSDVTVQASGFISALNTSAASFTLASLNHFTVVGVSTPGAGSTITTQNGFVAPSTMTGAVNNFGFRGSIASGTNRFNLYMDGTAANYLAGTTAIGSTNIDTGATLRITNGSDIVGVRIRLASGQSAGAVQVQDSSGNLLSGIASNGNFNIGTVQSTSALFRINKPITNNVFPNGIFITSQVDGDFVGVSTAYGYNSAIGASGTTAVPDIYNFGAADGTFVTPPTVLRGYVANLTGGVTNFNFQGFTNVGTGRWNLYMSGSAANYMLGRLGVGATLTSGAMAQVTNTTAADIGLVVKGAASQTGDLQQWQNSAATVLMRVTASGNVGINLNSFGTGVGVVAIANAGTVPSTNPTGGGVLYVEAGALKYRGSSGTISTIANA